MKKGVVAVLSTVVGAVAGYVGNDHINKKKISAKQKKIDKFKSYYNMLNQWLMLKQEGKSLESYFVDNDIKTIAIYGMGEMGNRLYDELINSDSVEIKYAIDANAANAYSEIDVLDIEEYLPEVDMVIVTAIFAYDEIVEKLSDKGDFRIISLEDVVYSI